MHALQRQIVRFSAAAGENELRRPAGTAIQNAGDDPGRLLNSPLGSLAHPVQAGGIAEILAPVRLHRLDHARVSRRGRAVVQIYLPLHDGLSFAGVGSSAR